MEGSGDQSFIPTNLGHVDEEIIPPARGGRPISLLTNPVFGCRYDPVLVSVHRNWAYEKGLVMERVVVSSPINVLAPEVCSPA
ncbi:hypothetical protein TNCV_4095001 [Trichonephila clavipes]|uniref:Uncharacterized protein n=1 Tax=Trichonephila clavipes TaxID=2585209 RepID=A0A8X6SAA4_TRICX|nr:hypothetical protein TNCV_4095001 [Trichonephila clavipes]